MRQIEKIMHRHLLVFWCMTKPMLSVATLLPTSTALAAAATQLREVQKSNWKCWSCWQRNKIFKVSVNYMSHDNIIFLNTLLGMNYKYKSKNEKRKKLILTLLFTTKWQYNHSWQTKIVKTFELESSRFFFLLVSICALYVYV